MTEKTSTEQRPERAHDYRTPDELADAQDLPAHERIALLQEWKRNILSLMVADGEGMSGIASADQERSTVLQSITDALARLQQSSGQSISQSDVYGSDVDGPR